MVIQSLPTGSHGCSCGKKTHSPKLVVLTGGPGGGKTAILEMARRSFCRHVVILPEAASIVFSGGFPRLKTTFGERSAQRAIYRIQRELEALATHENPAVILCDRGSIDGLAFWPGSRKDYFSTLDTTLERELSRYHTVIHIEVPTAPSIYHQNCIRRETLKEALAIDHRIGNLWNRHPRHSFISAEKGFLHKATAAIELLRRAVPACCRAKQAVSIANGG